MGIEERKQREKQKRREDIIKSARKVFAKYGLRKASIKEIARKAELSPQTIYTYFSTKQELYVGVLLTGFGILRDNLKKIADSEGDPVFLLNKVKEAYYNFFRTHQDYFNIMMFLGFDTIHNEVSRELCKRISDTMIQCLESVASIIERGKKEKVFTDVNSWRLSCILWSIFAGVAHFNETKRSINFGKDNTEKLLTFGYDFVIENIKYKKKR
jgi:AcrR family transcriptional regulator